MKPVRPLATILAWPLLIFIVGLGGLVIALTGDGWRDATAWFALLVPVAAVVTAMARHRFRKS
jgi:hypothetical protein